MANMMLLLLGAYLGIGLLFAVWFVLRGVGRVDQQAVDGSWGFRLLIMPGTAALWPLLLGRWLGKLPPPEERNPHRDRAERGSR